MKEFTRPQVVVSRCLEFDECRYNGLKIGSPVIKAMQEYVDFLPVCPEVEIGLGIPREAIRLAEVDGSIRLIKSMSGEDHTVAMQEFCEHYLHNLPVIHGFILKSRSPSCGIKEVKVYPGPGKVPSKHSSAAGFFSNRVLELFGDLAIEDEGRLTNLPIREHFLTKLFTLAEFNEIPHKMGALVDFHARNKYLFMAYNQTELKKAGTVVANHQKLPVEQLFQLYRSSLLRILSRPARISTNINVLMHLLGYFSKLLSAEEKAYFLDQLEKFRNRQIPAVALTSIIYSWIIRFKNDYLKPQTYFQPFPLQLLDVHDSGKGRLIK